MMAAVLISHNDMADQANKYHKTHEQCTQEGHNLMVSPTS